jgi:hypothetical protein
MADGVSVDLNALTTFAGSVGKSADANFTSGTTQAVAMTALTGNMRSVTGAPDKPLNVCLAPGSSQFQEAQEFTTRHDVMAQSALSLMDDALKGLIALAGGAETAAVRYAGTDQANAALQRLGSGAFDAKHPWSSMALPLTGRADVSGTGVTDAFTPGKSDAIFATGTPAPTTAPVSAKPADPHSDTFDQDVTRARAAYEHGQDPVTGPDDDDTEGTKIGDIVVPPDAGRLPLKPPPLVQPVTQPTY